MRKVLKARKFYRNFSIHIQRIFQDDRAELSFGLFCPGFKMSLGAIAFLEIISWINMNYSFN